MKINDPRITKEKLIEKIQNQTISYFKLIELGVILKEIGFEDNKYILKFKEDLTQKEIIEFYYKLDQK